VPYRELDETNIIVTIERLKARISERFPGSGLSKVADELTRIGNEVHETVAYLGEPNWGVRIPVVIAIVLIVVIAGIAMGMTNRSLTNPGWETINSGISNVVFVGIAINFLLSIETKVKRRRALKMIHQLRTVAHVVDMHQLTKDPERLTSPVGDTESSPQRTMTADQLGRYLDYCSELLSVTSKLAALLVQRFSDEVILDAVNDIETLATGLSGKIWQKIRLIDRPRAN
jgi:hypothetical protein